MERKLTAALLVMTVVALTLSAAAFAWINGNAKTAVHVKAHGTSCSEGYPAFTSCAQIVTTWPSLGDVDVLPVVFDLVEYREIRVGLSWPEAWGSMSWVRCKGDAGVGTIQNPGDHVNIYWTACQHASIVAPGFGWLHAATRGFVETVSPFAVVDCYPPPGPYEDWIFCGGAACAVGGLIGDDPCEYPTGTDQSTWGAIKAIFGK